MKDIIVRLASMKLAELKFDVETIVHSHSVITKKKTFVDPLGNKNIREIKEYLSKRWGLSKDAFKASDSYMLSEGYNDKEGFYRISVFFSELNALKDIRFELRIQKPDSINEKTFKSIMSATFRSIKDIEKIILSRI